MVGKVRQVAEGAAAMTGARLEVEEFYPFYENVQPNVTLAQAVGANAQALGMRLDEPVAGRPGSGASTDFGNVSQVMPAFELRYAVSETPVASHTRDMAETAVTELALSNALLVAKTLSHDGGRPAPRCRAGGGGQGRVRGPQRLRVSSCSKINGRVRLVGVSRRW